MNTHPAAKARPADYAGGAFLVALLTLLAMVSGWPWWAVGPGYLVATGLAVVAVVATGVRVGRS